MAQASLYDTPQQLMSVLGSFWNRNYSGGAQIESFVRAHAQVGQQTLQDTMEVVASLSRYTVPLFHRDNWYMLTLRQSERNNAQTSLLRYDAGGVYDAGARYDVPQHRENSAFPAPADLADVSVVVNRFTDPTLTWMKGLDFFLDPTNSAIVFRTNPFDDPRVPTQPVYENGVVIDQAATLWLFQADFDWEFAYQQFGYALGIRMASSEGYRSLLNAILDGIVKGPSRGRVEAGLSAITGIPLVIEPTEVVEQLSVDNNSRLIITDQHVYKFTMASVPIVAVGDVVHAGDPLTDGLQLVEIGNGVTPDDLMVLALGKGFVSACFQSDLLFENKDVPLEVITDDPSGYTKLKWGLGGFPLDVSKFFSDLHDRGVAASQAGDPDTADNLTKIPGDPCEDVADTYRPPGTLAHLLDLRETRTGEPTAASLPRTINPLQFVIANVLRNNAFLVRVKSVGMPANRLGLHNVRLLRKIVPPHTAMILIIEMALQADGVAVAQVGEELTTFQAMEPLVEEVSPTLVGDTKLGLRVISGSCH